MEKKTRKSQCDRVLDYMQTHNGITDSEARELLHLNRLSGRIWDLKKRDISIGTVWEAGKNVYGDNVRYVRYFLKEGD
jgi:hypothetical protein